ncbi:MFS transporter [Bradyrhizobium sp. U87765 SZCCT0131]|uniref:MFS transporter n=1 Tax=unclassified Bradyrhizobium TaxID=2631580 RepID=UPI001BA5983E|nr:MULTISPECIES: MFS transporter [unclassified Bradyrhizobium]MBR1219711.1 MFS transporter [Bradyrhizobium sp. U87765 SZCCT0131]MBR1262362.1 MFS transporter [Bradyrhizobium sp. U87765 SZCCT0134]MBR1308455.1 MFS transporter [Bradyrhizobium sp. U87765 SZCCT0110]MBR1318144.1 MFS transporter [Bradyrhizobium sp. U87765 SZCCT0109]MBR1351847.1 MFS transporter [Bradyrhizobium sp. U87765 SZCCT0048]
MPPDRQNPATQQPEARRFARRLALVYGAVFGLGGISLPYFPVWLKAVGVDVGWIGIITAVPALTRFTVLPFVTGFAERRNALREGIVLLAFLTSLGFLAIGQLREPLLILAVFAVTACVWTPIIPMVDGYALKGVARHGIDYGPVRLWGSAAFIVGSLACGVMIDFVTASFVIWVIAAIALIEALTSLGLQRLDRDARPIAGASRASALLRQPGFLAIIFTSALVQGSHAVYYAFASIAWQNAGLGGLTVSALWSIGVVAEIIVFAVSPRFKWSPLAMVAFAAAIAALRWAITAQQPPLPLLAVVQTLHGLSFGLTQVGIVGLFTRNVPGHVLASAQGYLVAATGLVMSSATMGAGLLYARYGEGAYYAMSAMALGGCVLIVLARKWLVTTDAAADR